MNDEPAIEINGKTLSGGQAMAIRVACSAYFKDMISNPDALGADEHGRAMTASYRIRLAEVLQLMILDEMLEGPG
jgi:hypothetical protein